MVYFANSDIDLIRGAGDTRRRFLDFVGSQLFKNYREILRSYEKALHSRNRCLKMIPARPREVNAYSKPLFHFGHQLTALRAFLMERLEPYVIEAFAAVSDSHETSRLRYRPGATADFEKALRESKGRKSRLRMTLVGPHRDDFQLILFISQPICLPRRASSGPLPSPSNWRRQGFWNWNSRNRRCCFWTMSSENSTWSGGIAYFQLSRLAASVWLRPPTWIGLNHCQSERCIVSGRTRLESGYWRVGELNRNLESCPRNSTKLCQFFAQATGRSSPIN